MIENDVERIGKKIDLFFKILLGLNVPHIGHPYNRKYIDGYMNELILVYNLSAEKDIIENYPTQEIIQIWNHELNNELDKLKQDYEQGNFIAKEQDAIKTRIKDLKNKLNNLSKLSENKEKFENKNTELYKISLFIDLQKKLKIIELHDNYSYRKLIREKDNLKKNIQELVIKLHNYFKTEEI